MAKPLEILIIEDSQDDAELLVREMHQEGIDVRHLRVETAPQMHAALDNQPWDLILSDYDLPKFSGPAALQIVQERGLDLPFIVVSGKIGEEKAISFMKAGAHDYIMKSNLSRLVPAVQRELREAEERRERRRAEAELKDTKNRLEKVLQETADAIGIADNRGYFYKWNKVAEQLYGYSYEEMKGMHFTRLYPDKEAMEKMLGQLRREGLIRRYEIDMRRKDGSIAPFEISIRLLRDEDNNVIGSISVARDLSELKKALTEVTRVNAQLRGEIEERQRVEKTLKEQFFFLETLIDNIPSPIFYKNVDGVYLGCNQALCDFLGLPKEAIIGKTVYDLHPQDQADRYFEMDSALFRRPGVQVYDFSTPHADGTIHEVNFRKATYGNADGALAGLVGVMLDITHRKQMEEALQEIQSQQKAILDNIPDIAWLKDREGRYLAANEPFALACGYDREELVGKTDFDFWPRDLAEKYRRDDAEVIRLGERKLLEETLVDKAGKMVWIETIKTPVYNDQGEVIGTTGIAREFTARKQAADELRRTHKEIEQLFESIPFIMIGLSPDGRISHWNHVAVKTLWAQDPPEAGKNLRDYSQRWEWDKVLQGIENCREKGIPVRLDDIRYQRVDGKDGVLGITFSPIKEENGRITGLILLGRDITEQRLLEAQLAQAQKLESIGQLAAGIAHEINTPIQYVGDNIRFLQEAFADLLVLMSEYGKLRAVAEGGGQAPEVIKGLKKVEEQTDPEYLEQEIPKAIAQSLEGVARVAKIVRAMKDFSHPGTGEKTALDINKAVESTITVARNEWKYVAEMVTDLAPGLPLVPCLPDEFNQVLLNLIINGAHAIGEVLAQGGQNKGTITISTREDGDWVEVRVKDTGPGIPPEIRSKIFDPFFTTKEVGKGTGQGLAISHSVIVDKHGGTISFESEMGQGTTFIIRLPRGELGS
ncbi:MAG: PAS domain S-box protein [Thermodesulfobacteriota bacterium]